AQLDVDDMVEALRGWPEASVELILAADAMVYVPDLAPVLREVKRVLTPGGLVTFTVETHDRDDVILGAGLRYAHGADYVRRNVAAGGLALAHLEQASPRTEDNKPVRGLVVVARKA